jgi:phenylalanyl-tRNA synthetase beta chain
MTLSYNWLSTYLPVSLSPETLSEILTAVGLEVEHMEKSETITGGLAGVVIGKVMTCVPHPNADKLRLTTVDIGGSQVLPIVCGAPNVAAGQTVVVATVGATLYPTQGESFSIKKAKIRGEESEGMICAEDEIGLGESHAGIMILPDHLSAGMPASEYFQLPEPDYIYEIGLTPNRMDAMSHLGAARDICAYLSNKEGTPIAVQVPAVALPAPSASLPIQITIEDNARCARYAGICISDITVAESPEWLQTRLKAIGLRPVNNVVDITNFVLHECGQPLHAFDYETITGNHIVVKTMAQDTPFITLDEQERKLSSADLMICNAEEPMCIAGVFGGAKSGVSATTKSVFLESAWFAGETIRLSSLRHGLRTDAAQRFEKGADISRVIYALQRAAQWIIELAGGKIASDIYDIYPQPKTRTEVNVDLKSVNQLAGKEYDAYRVKHILQALGFDLLHEEGTQLRLAVPFSKTDISMQADVVEEIMRIDGLDNIPFTGKIAYSLPENTVNYVPEVKKQVTQILVGKGVQEIFTNSIINSAYYEEKEGLVMMMNNLSAELDCLRPSMLESGLQVIAWNLNRRNKQLCFFEFGKTYHRHANGFEEKERLSLYCSGQYRSQNWKEQQSEIDFYYVKGLLDALLQNMKLEWKEEGNAFQLLFQRKPLGSIQQISASQLDRFDIKQGVWFVDLDWQMIKAFYEKQKISYKGIPKFPTVQRDLALILDKQVRYQEVQAAVRQTKSKLLQDIHLFDVFESEKLGQNKKSYAINLSFYDDTKTLTDTEVDSEMNAIIGNLETKVGAQIRGKS